MYDVFYQFSSLNTKPILFYGKSRLNRGVWFHFY